MMIWQEAEDKGLPRVENFLRMSLTHNEKTSIRRWMLVCLCDP